MPGAYVLCGDIGVVATEVVGGTVRLDFHQAPERRMKGRSAFTLGLVADVGATVNATSAFVFPGLAYGFHLALGWVNY
jgi:hypothetical protein